MGTNWAISYVRTVVAPLVIGTLIQLVLFAWSDDGSSVLRALTTALLACAWYSVVRILQEGNRKLGFLLLIAARPHYTEDVSDDDDELLTSLVRSIIPLVVGGLLTMLVVGVGDVDSAAIVVVTQFLITSAYYGALRLIEESAASETRRIAGLMLGAPLVPHY